LRSALCPLEGMRRRRPKGSLFIAEDPEPSRERPAGLFSGLWSLFSVFWP